MVGQRIRYYRKTKGLTQEELAQGICSVSYLSKIEKGDAKSSEEVINLLCDRLGISPEEMDDNQVLGMLNEWYLQMVNRNFDKAETFLYETVQPKMKNVMEPDLILRYELFLSRFHMVHHIHPDLEGSFNRLKKAESFFAEMTPDLKFYYLNFLSLYYNIKREYKKALDLLIDAEVLYNTKTTGITQSEGAVLFYHLALTYNYLCRVTSVNQYAFKAINIFDKEYNYSRSADCQILLGTSNRRVGNYDQANYHLKQALKYSTAFNDHFTNGVIYHNLGYVASCQSLHREALEYFHKSIEAKQKVPNNESISTIMLIAREYFLANDKNNAKIWLNKGLNIIGKNAPDDQYYHFMILEQRIDGNIEKLEEILSKAAIPYFEKVNIWEYVAEFSEMLADIYFDQSLYKKSSQYYRRANNALKNIF
ncbi:helix-turn-helix domain-containing protein [Fictibacillus barbaricus]|uniref:Transcriptional regulator with XRE-family HTH domain/Tfp pilus assembly protein PilF n=1 Tax=Fictibacillus barbaricus TaxID=182136 RepID=A0ABU1U661_9BACL|nr:helix-turn-helix domain-containing protein [Fictibacillus barbaricus]MDR7074911.1 transcriptional regulator with XRE-family HTH domain/Tfp pilus assembly protein PilF [Fictibacillus barbaricus]